MIRSKLAESSHELSIRTKLHKDGDIDTYQFSLCPKGAVLG